MAVVSSVPVLKILTLRVTFLPRLLVKKPLSTPTRAGACVMLARKPSRSVTGAGACVMLARKPSRSVTGAAAALELELEDEPDDPHAAASTMRATAPAESSARRIKVHLIGQVDRYYRIKPYRGTGTRMLHGSLLTCRFYPDSARSITVCSLAVQTSGALSSLVVALPLQAVHHGQGVLGGEAREAHRIDDPAGLLHRPAVLIGREFTAPEHTDFGQGVASIVGSGPKRPWKSSAEIWSRVSVPWWKSAVPARSSMTARL